MSERRVIIVGAGGFGAAAALGLRSRGWAVTLVDPGPLPHPLAASTDISKVVRVEYGADDFYTELGERSVEGWRRLNRELPAPVYHETGVVFVRQGPLVPGGFEHDSLATLRARGLGPERLDAAELARRFPAWSTGRYTDGFFHAVGGFVESGRVVSALIERAAAAGVELRAGAAFARLVERGSRVVGVETDGGEQLLADAVLVAAGAWTPFLLPDLAPQLRSTGHPVFHLRPSDPGLFAPGRFSVFGAAISESGWYGFPLHPTEGVVKIARHGDGRSMHPASPERLVQPGDHEALRAFLAETFPALLDAPVVFTRVCFYCDTNDGHFLVDQHPARPGLFVAAGDSGHGFKFVPALGDLIADVVEGHPGAPAERFRWRESAAPLTREAARSTAR